MDIVLEFCDTFILDKAYAKLFPAVPLAAGNATSGSALPSAALLAKIASYGILGSPNDGRERYGRAPTYFYQPTEWAMRSLLTRDNVIRQSLSLFVIATIFGWLLYFSMASFSYFAVFDKTALHHPKFLKNQIRMEIQQASFAMPVMSALTVPWFVFETQGYSKLYFNIDDYGWKYLLLSFPLFILFTDMLIYCIHRWLHAPYIYKYLHKRHHKWIVPTPYASHAFNPVDGYLQSVPYHLFPFLFPLLKIEYVALFAIVNIWTVTIHDGEYLSHDVVVNGSACHAIHHLYFNYNYGQYTTLWDRIGGSYRAPDEELFDRNKKMAKDTWDKQVRQMEVIVKEVEGEDGREYVKQEVAVAM